jgi:hypothetical protein
VEQEEEAHTGLFLAELVLDTVKVLLIPVIFL